MSTKAIHSLQEKVKSRFNSPVGSLKSLQQLALDTGLSVQTLRRFFGKISGGNSLSYSTLSLLAKYCGYLDWEHFYKDYSENTESNLEKDMEYIRNMSVFFEAGQKHDIDYYRDTAITDTFNGYAKIIYKSKDTLVYFHHQYSQNNWATDYIYAWIPNYNLFAQDYYRKIIRQKADSTTNPIVRLSQLNFLLLGDFLSCGNVKYKPTESEWEKTYNDYRKLRIFMPFHEMRYTSLKLIRAFENGDFKEYNQLLEKYLLELKENVNSDFQRQELKLFLANTIILFGDISAAYKLIEEFHLDGLHDVTNSLHYYGINRSFVMDTINLINVLKHNKIFIDVEAVPDENDFLYHDYNKHLECIISSFASKASGFLDENTTSLVQKTNYQIFSKMAHRLVIK
ncbi:hypothetical protein [Planobacterium oryzisoli]|uniref:Uncharacterized protein n=1 Tax=Planobacterium oryzisoli TaxID=2771435 RepID=A0A931E7E6_9FLAO|nr:hypothetical protein [Planobacterium oryzisoli]MBF5027141.1 hypothetical protein [Planobacterium oryzisoli]